MTIRYRAIEALKYALVLTPALGIVPFALSTIQNDKNFDDAMAGLCLGIWNGLAYYAIYKYFF